MTPRRPTPGILRSNDDRHSHVVGELDRSRAEIACSSFGDDRQQVGAYERQHGLRLRVAEPAVELEHTWTVSGEHQARVERPENGAPRDASSASTGL